MAIVNVYERDPTYPWYPEAEPDEPTDCDERDAREWAHRKGYLLDAECEEDECR